MERKLKITYSKKTKLNISKETMEDNVEQENKIP